jgi:hypothetical protein
MPNARFGTPKNRLANATRSIKNSKYMTLTFWRMMTNALTKGQYEKLKRRALLLPNEQEGSFKTLASEIPTGVSGTGGIGIDNAITRDTSMNRGRVASLNRSSAIGDIGSSSVCYGAAALSFC